MSMIQDPTLKPCPFCGGPNVYFSSTYDRGSGWGDDNHGTIRCNNVGCFARVGENEMQNPLTREAVTKIWNSRQTPEIFEVKQSALHQQMLKDRSHDSACL